MDKTVKKKLTTMHTASTTSYFTVTFSRHAFVNKANANAMTTSVHYNERFWGGGLSEGKLVGGKKKLAIAGSTDHTKQAAPGSLV